MFTRYMHLERYGTDPVIDITDGVVHVFPKLDGTNASVWIKDGQIEAGSRNRKLSKEHDNAGFYNWVVEQKNIYDALLTKPNYTLYGEWLVPHTLQTYRADAWRKFYIFDVYDRETERYLSYDEYKPFLDAFGLTYLPPLVILKDAAYEHLLHAVNKNVFLIEDGKGIGEGVVLKNYEWKNPRGNIVWAKIITNAFKEENHRVMGSPVIGPDLVEEKIIEEYVSQHFVDKVVAKISVEHDGWNAKYIPQLLNTVYYDLITEEMWDIVKKYKQPKIDFGLLNKMCIRRIKELRKDIF